MLSLLAQEQDEPPGLIGLRGPDLAASNADGTAHWLGDGPWMKALQHGPLHRLSWPRLAMLWRHRTVSHAPVRAPGTWRVQHIVWKQAACPGQERGGRDCRPVRVLRLTLRVLRSHPLAPLRTADIEVLVIARLTIRSCKAYAFLRPTRTSSATLETTTEVAVRARKPCGFHSTVIRVTAL